MVEGDYSKGKMEDSALQNSDIEIYLLISRVVASASRARLPYALFLLCI